MDCWNAGQQGQPADLPHHAAVPAEVLPPGAQFRAGTPEIECNTHTGDILSQHRGPRRTGHTPAKHQYKQQIQPHIEQRTDRQEPERRGGIAQGTQKAGKKVIEERGDQPRKNDQQIGLHQPGHFRRYL